jgi:hypothetical protein
VTEASLSVTASPLSTSEVTSDACHAMRSPPAGKETPEVCSACLLRLLDRGLTSAGGARWGWGSAPRYVGTKRVAATTGGGTASDQSTD